MSINKKFAKYISLNIIGMLGVSCYILADTIFISKAEGSNGLTALNLVLPIYSLIFAFGAMLGVGSAIRYSIAKSRGDKDKDQYLFQALFFTTVIGLLFMLVGFFWPDRLLALLGADEEILQIGVGYIRIFLSFAPFFMWNHIANAFVRNDGAPALAMTATVSSSFFNIAFDYIFMFPMGMGMKGAALATAISPILGVVICCIHLFTRKNTIRLKLVRPSLKEALRSARLGIAAFVGEISSGVITLAFNYIILGLTGNVGVAAYGVVANTAIVSTAIFNGIAQGSQPLFSDSYGRGMKEEIKAYRRLAFGLSLVVAAVSYVFLFLNTDAVVRIFNGEQNQTLADLAFVGVRLYFIGMFFAGLNIVGGSYFSAIEDAKSAFAISILRGFVLILLAAFLLAAIFGMAGVWLSYAVAEGLTLIVMVIFLLKKRSR